MGERGGRSSQQVFEESSFGRRMISGWLVFTLASIVVWNLPSSVLRETAQPLIAPYLRTVGLTQSWQLFAPDPARTSRELYARVTYADGSEELWRPPDGVLLDSYRAYRWRKWTSELRQDSSDAMWEPAARYIAHLHVDDGTSPASVALVRRWADVPALGSGLEPEWEEFEFYTLELDPETGSVVEQ